MEPYAPAPQRSWVRVCVVVSRSFPGIDVGEAEPVCRFTRIALTTLHELGAEYALGDISTALDIPLRSLISTVYCRWAAATATDPASASAAPNPAWRGIDLRTGGTVLAVDQVGAGPAVAACASDGNFEGAEDPAAGTWAWRGVPKTTATHEPTRWRFSVPP